LNLYLAISRSAKPYVGISRLFPQGGGVPKWSTTTSLSRFILRRWKRERERFCFEPYR